MKVLIIGQGGREHALVKSLARAPSVSEIHVIPGNDGMSREALCHPLDWRETEALIGFCLRTEIDFKLSIAFYYSLLALKCPYETILYSCQGILATLKRSKVMLRCRRQILWERTLARYVVSQNLKSFSF